MMTKGILYMVGAVLLGVALILTPRLLLLTPEGYDFSSARGAQTPFTKNELAYGVAPHYPADEISIGLMSTFSLILAFVVFKQHKKRTA